MADTPEIASAKRILENQATSALAANWARQLLDYIAQVESDNERFRKALMKRPCQQ